MNKKTRLDKAAKKKKDFEKKLNVKKSVRESEKENWRELKIEIEKENVEEC